MPPVVGDGEHLGQTLGGGAGGVEQAGGLEQKMVGVEGAARQRRQPGEPPGHGGGGVAPQQSTAHRGQLVEGLDERREVAVEDAEAGPVEEGVVVGQDLGPGVGGGGVVAGHRREAGGDEGGPGRAAPGVEEQDRVRRGDIGNPPGTDEAGDGRPGDAHCPRLAEQ